MKGMIIQGVFITTPTTAKESRINQYYMDIQTQDGRSAKEIGLAGKVYIYVFLFEHPKFKHKTSNYFLGDYPFPNLFSVPSSLGE